MSHLSRRDLFRALFVAPAAAALPAVTTDQQAVDRFFDWATAPTSTWEWTLRQHARASAALRCLAPADLDEDFSFRRLVEELNRQEGTGGV